MLLSPGDSGQYKAFQALHCMILPAILFLACILRWTEQYVAELTTVLKNRAPDVEFTSLAILAKMNFSL